MADEPAKKQSTIKELELEGIKFTVNTDLLDDVEAFEHVDRIENKGQVAAIVPLLKFLIGEEGYNKLKADFTAADAKEHEGEPGYNGRFRVTKLSKIYEVIIENFNPKD
jgi:hypothetical protein